MCELLTLLMTSTGFQGASANAQQFKKGPVFVACWVYMRRNSTSPVMWGLMIIYFINHNLRIPSLNNQDSMESKKVFFIAQLENKKSQSKRQHQVSGK